MVTRKPRTRFFQNVAKRYEDKLSTDEKISIAEREVRTQIRLFGVDGGPTANARKDLAERLEGADRWIEARVLREEVLAGRRRHLGADHRETLVAELWLARNLSRDCIYDQALALAVHARDGFVDQEDIEAAERAVSSIERSRGGAGG